jgi:two-component system chemotaxis response regulator CheY
MQALNQIRVLMVEPSISQQKIISAYLKQHEVGDIRYVATQSEALAEMRAEETDLVISAMHLPDGTGTELVQTMRGDAQLQEIVFMLISSETNMHYLDPIRQAGAIAILPKPFDQDQMRAALYSTLDLLNPEELALEELAAEDLKVLVVDDSSMARKHIGRVLSSMGIENITLANDGAEAVPILDETFFDLVITDYNMPQMDGDQLVAHIRNRSMQREVPILMVTSEDDDLRLAAACQVGVSALSDKPFEPGNIRALITQLLN